MTSYNDYEDHPVRDTPAKRPEEVGKQMAMKMAMVSKMDRSELEDKYIRLYEQYLVIKVHAQKQEDKIKRLGIMQQKLMSDKKKILDEGGKPRTRAAFQSDDRVDELEVKLREMERLNGNLTEKVKNLKRQLSLAQEARTMQSDSRLKTGRQQTMYDPRIAKNIRFAGPPSMQRTGQGVGVSSAAFDDARAEIRKRDQFIQEQQETMANYEAEVESLKQKLQAKDVEFEEGIMQLKMKLNQDQKANIQENIELIKLQRELREKSASLTQLHAKYSDLDEKMRLMKASHDQLLNELEMTNRNLQMEQSKSTSLHGQLKQGTSSNILLAEREEKISDLERECQILKEANEQLLSNAFNLEKEREWRSKEKALKLQIAQLEATLKADVSEKGGILDKLCEKTDSHEQLEEEHRELRCKYYELKNQHDQLVDKMKYFSKDSGVNMDEIEEALVLVRHRKESQDPQLDFLHKVDEEQNKDLGKLVKQLQAEHADTINELEKTRNMLIVQHKINKDYQAEVVCVTKKMDELKRESDLRLSEYAQLLDIRAARIKKLEAQLRDVAYGTRQYRIKPEDADELVEDQELDDTMHLELGQNLFEIHVTRVALSSEGLHRMNDSEPNIFCTWEFYEFEMQTTPIQRGPKADFEFTSQYVVSVDDFFLHYLQKDSCVLELHQSFGTDYQTVAVCHLRLHDILEKSQGRLHGTVVLTGVNDGDTGVNYGTVDYWVRLRVPMEQALRLYKERSKALGYIESNLAKSTGSKMSPLDEQAAKRAPENINQLHITIVQCLNVKSRRKDVQPSPFCIYKFFDFNDHDTAIVENSNNPHFDDHRKFPVPMIVDLDKYLKGQALKVYCLDDADPDETSYLGIATIPLIPLGHDKPIQGTFELITKEGRPNGTVDVILQWQYAYLPPTVTSRTLQMSAGMTQQESLPLLPGEEEMMRESVVAGGPSVMKSAKGTKSTAPSAASIRSTPSPVTSMKPSPMLSSNKPVQSLPLTGAAVVPKAASRSGSSSPQAALKSVSIAPSVDQSVDLEASYISEGQHVSGESEPVSEQSTPRGSVSSKGSGKRATRFAASNGSETENTMTQSGNGFDRGANAEEPVDIDTDEDAITPMSGRSEADDSDVIQSSHSAPRASSGQLTSNNVRVTVSRATIDDPDVLNNDAIKMLYVEYSFLGIPLEETETPFSLPKSSDKGMNYNFTKEFSVDAKRYLERRQRLASMIIPNADLPDSNRLRFALVSEPQEEDDDCADVGVAYVNILEILRSGRNLVNEIIPVLDNVDETKQIGSLEVSVECILALKEIEKELRS